MIESLLPLVWLDVDVLDPYGDPAAGAEVFLDGDSVGFTDLDGRLRFAATDPTGKHVVARQQMDHHAGYKADHDGWVYRVYQMSRLVNLDGSIADAVVPPPDLGPSLREPIPLQLQIEQPLIGLHLVVSLSWDASADELEDYRFRMMVASQYLYNATDGQFFFEQVEIADDGQGWGSGDLLFDLDNTRRPQTNWTGGFLAPILGSVPGKITMAKANDPAVSELVGDFYGLDDPRTVVHELGHLALGLGDEYVGFNWIAGNHCSAARLDPTAEAGHQNAGPAASCLMDSQFLTSKLCSNFAPNDPRSHRGGLLQPYPCWHTIDATYSDDRLEPRWQLTTPDERGDVPGTLPWQVFEPRITVINRQRGDLCEPFVVKDPPSARDDVWVMPAEGAPFTLGDASADGTIIVSGAHVGDQIVTAHGAGVVLFPGSCTVTR
ncbi:MAG: hypothetical protein ABMA64_36800 [Myxococcota bacterium]